MFIELTDHFRCPADHEEQYLVLLPELIEDRWVRTGHLGCPVCGRTFRLADGTVDLGDAPAEPAEAGPTLEPDALAALVGLNGPGGYLVLVGAVAADWRRIAEAIPAVGLVAVNPPATVADEPGVSVVRAGMIPIKQSNVRGVVLSAPFGSDTHWVAEAARVTLPGLRVVGQGELPTSSSLELLASAEGYWVGARVRAGNVAPR